MSSTKSKVSAQEVKDFQRAEKVLRELLQDKVDSGEIKNLVFMQTPEFCHYDMTVGMEWNGNPWNVSVEIKERNKETGTTKEWMCSELTESKRNYVLSSSFMFDQVLYVSLVNDFMAYIWDLREHVWKEEDKFLWRIKNTQYSNNTHYILQPTYKMYWDTADWSVRI